MAGQVLTERLSVSTPAARMESSAAPKGAAVDAERQQNVRVCVRVRPLSDAERERGDQPVWVVEGNQVCLARHGSAPKYAFETVHREASANRDVYQAVGAPVVQSAIAGINGTIFAYGVTSSGKTHTMMGQRGEPGLVPLALQHLFQLIDGARDRFFLLKFSMLEIYNETINDLLDPASVNLRLREDTTRDLVFVEGIKNVEVRTRAPARRSMRMHVYLPRRCALRSARMQLVASPGCAGALWRDRAADRAATRPRAPAGALCPAGVLL